MTASPVGRALAVIVLATLGCRGGASDAPESQTGAPAAVTILAPAQGDTLSLPVTVRLTAIGVEVVPATGIREPAKGHHHLVIDADVGSVDVPLPAIPGVIHLGSGASEHVIDSLPPGPHRIIAVFAAGDHVPMPDVRQDTVRFVVR